MLKVVKIVPNKITKTLCLSDATEVEVTKSARVKVDDTVRWHGQQLLVVCANGEAIVYPLYNEREDVILGDYRLKLYVKEPDTQQELDEIHYLERFHYLGAGAVSLSTLALVTYDETLPKVLGFAVMMAGMHACVPRTPIVRRLFNKAYNPSYFSVRVARVVVHPEFRALGLAKLLLKHCIQFAQTHWTQSSMKPELIEIVAEMLKYVPFADRVGMKYLGDTGGMRGNIADIEKLRAGLQEKRDGMRQYQLARAERLHEIAKQLNLPPNEVMRLVRNYEKLTPQQRLDLFPILRTPKPFYCVGLTDKVNEIVNELAQDTSHFYVPVRQLKISGPVRFEDVDIIFHETTKITDRTVNIQAAFGVSPKLYVLQVLEKFNFIVEPCSIVLLRGISGSGKTTVLKMFRGELAPSNGNVHFPLDAKIAELLPVEGELRDEPLIELVGDTFESALYALNKVGLAEAKLYLKSYKSLSSGQKYRASFAKMMTSNANIWIADEFCSSLDRLTANIVAYSVQKQARRDGITFIAACANPEAYISALNPDYVIDLATGRSKIIKYRSN